MSRTRLAQERPAEALRLLEQAVPFIGDHLSRLELHGQLAAACIRVGQFQRAHVSARAALLLATAVHPQSFSTLTGLAGATETLLALCALSRRNRFEADTEALTAEVRRALSALHHFARIFTIGIPAYYYSQGVYSLISGDESAAFAHWQRAIEAATARRMPHQRARAAACIALACEATLHPLALFGISQPNNTGSVATKAVKITPHGEVCEPESLGADPLTVAGN